MVPGGAGYLLVIPDKANDLSFGYRQVRLAELVAAAVERPDDRIRPTHQHLVLVLVRPVQGGDFGVARQCIQAL